MGSPVLCVILCQYIARCAQQEQTGRGHSFALLLARDLVAGASRWPTPTASAGPATSHTADDDLTFTRFRLKLPVTERLTPQPQKNMNSHQYGVKHLLNAIGFDQPLCRKLCLPRWLDRRL